MRSNLKIIVAAMLMALIATAAVAAAPKKGKDRRNTTIALLSDAEDRGIAFCSKALTTAPNAKTLPKGLIKTAHFVENKAKGYVQVTGRMDSRKYQFRKGDDGGQCDLKAPHGSACAGYKSFVQLIEPDANIYCVRCCKNKADCPVNKSTYGCKKVLGGNYA
ncbi:hypothetical protein BGZ70_000541 [Mortierella alpina]|uniref:Uncharacterized protein n=1 Tax=Mortierella alpina TaxID=64518 RepID=A0A9P6IXN8_MORAP|nr:hypothetical protein BGZ70_000541 [Mortierella alpina]